MKFAVRVVVLAVLFFLGKGLAESILDDRVEGLAYSALYSLTVPDLRSDQIPVRVIDISEVAKFRTASEPTPATVLIDVIRTLSALDPPPRAIGIDIDFAARAPDDPGTIRGSSPVATMFGDHLRFLRFAADQADLPGPKLFVGVGTVPTDPMRVFIPEPSNEEMERLAGRLSRLCALVVTDRDSATMPRYYRGPGESEPLFSLGHRLAQTIDPVTNQSESPWQRLLSWLSPPHQEDLPWEQQTIAVDYGLLVHRDSITFKADISETDHGVGATLETEMTRIRASIQGFKSPASRGYAVLVGYGQDTSADSMVIQPSGKAFVPLDATIYPRIYQHAAYVFTYLQRPFVKTSALVGLALEILVSLAFFWLGGVHEGVIHRITRGNRVGRAGVGLVSGMYFVGLLLLSLGVLLGLGVRAPVTSLVISTVFAGVLAGHFMIGCRNNEEFSLCTQTVRSAMMRLAMTGLVVGLTLLLATMRVFWTGSLVVVLFIILEGYFEPILEYAGVTLVQRIFGVPANGS